MNSQINLGTMDENWNSKEHTIKILLDDGASVSIVSKDVLHERHKIIEQKKFVWSTMAGIFNTTSTKKLNLKLLESNHTAKI